MKKTDYHGGSFEGNESKRLLKNVDCLQHLSTNEEVMRYVDAFKDFNEVVSACYGEFW